MRVETTIKIVDTETNTLLPNLISAITMNFDGESIVFDDLGAATPLIFLTAALLGLPMIGGPAQVFPPTIFFRAGDLIF